MTKQNKNAKPMKRLGVVKMEKLHFLSAHQKHLIGTKNHYNVLYVQKKHLSSITLKKNVCHVQGSQNGNKVRKNV